MIKLKNILDNSAYAIIGSANTNDDLELIERFLIYNRDFIKQFKYKIIAQNGSLSKESNEIWIKHFGECIFINLPVNRGKVLGTYGVMDLDNSIFEYTLQHKDQIKWVWKFSNDIIINSNIFDLDVEEADFYFLNNIGYSGVQKWGGVENLTDILMRYETYYPQTFFYIIKNDIDYLSDMNLINKMYELNLKTPNKQPWELGIEFSCEKLLLDCVERNKLRKHQLLDKETLNKLINLIYMYKIADGSHKNILLTKLGNFCHFQNIDKPVISI